MQQIIALFRIDPLSILMMGLITFITIIVIAFSRRYMSGDRKKNAFYQYVSIMFLSICTLTSANHMALFLATWILSNYFLTRLMQHKKEWPEAVASANLALKNFVIGSISLLLAFSFLAPESLLISEINFSTLPSWKATIAGFFILIAALSQSGIWPFHRWLISSLNSPTPVSALMHAGLVNGGGFLLARFAELYFQQSLLLHLIFIAGICTAILGTWWKLMQNDIKRMLACSTMGQMGFMIAECGLGLFAAAVSHLIWHGIFKAYLFLNSGGGAGEHKLTRSSAKLTDFLIASVIGLFGLMIFIWVSGRPILPNDSSLIIHLLAWITCSQGALSLLQSQYPWPTVTAFIPSALIGAIYALNLAMVETYLEPLKIQQVQAISFIHIIAFGFLFFTWLLMIFTQSSNAKDQHNLRSVWQKKLYVKLLNGSQPHPETVTAHRNHYHY